MNTQVPDDIHFDLSLKILDIASRTMQNCVPTLKHIFPRSKFHIIMLRKSIGMVTAELDRLESEEKDANQTELEFQTETSVSVCRHGTEGCGLGRNDLCGRCQDAGADSGVECA